MFLNEILEHSAIYSIVGQRPCLILILTPEYFTVEDFTV